jgi:hypothetical protein
MRADPKRVVVIRRSFSTGLGVVCRVGVEWALVRIIDDLRVDGWECLRVRDVESVTRGTHERFAEKVLSLSSAVPRLSLDSTHALLDGLPARRLVALECEGDGDFLLGRSLALDEASVVVHPIKASGRWFGHATRVRLDDITRVAFGDHYARMFERHGPPWRAPRAAPRDRSRGSR